MDWARDQAEVSKADLDNVFRYEEKPTTVIRVLTDKEVVGKEVKSRVFINAI